MSCGPMRFLNMACWMSSRSLVRSSCTADTFMLTGTRCAPCSRHWVMSLPMRSSTNWPMGMMRPVSSATSMKCSGDMIALRRMLPAQQRLEAGDAPRMNVDDGLVVHVELVELERDAQGRFDGHAFLERTVHLRREHLEVVSAQILRLVHRRVRVLEQLAHGGAVAREQADADAHGGHQRAAVDHHRRGQHLVDARRGDADFIGRVDLVQHDDEFVAAHANHDVRGPHRRAHALGDLLQQLVAHFVAARVVDVLEAVEIEEQHREHLPGFLAARDGFGQVRLQEQAVRQARQVIVIGELVEALLVGEQLRLRLLSFRQIAHEVGHQAPVARFDGHAAHFDVHLAAVLEPLHELDAAARLDARQRGDDGILRIVRAAQHRQHRTAAQFVQRESELLLHGRIGIDDLAGARIGHQQSVLRLFDDGAVARLERQPVGVETARARHEQHGDDGESADQQAEQDGLVERRARRLRERAARDFELHQPDGRAHLVAKDEIAVQVVAARNARHQVGGQRRLAHPVAHLVGHAGAIEVRHRKAGHRPGREAAHALHDGGREGARECDPAMRLPGAGAVENRPHREQRRAARALHDAALAVGVAVELPGRHGLLDGGQQFRIGRDLVFLHGGRIDRERSARLEIAVEHQEGVDVEAHQRAGVERLREEVGAIAARELRGLVPDRVVAHRRVEIFQLGGEAALQLLALHVDVARLDVGDVDQPAALRPAIENHQNDGDHRAYHGQRRLPDSGFGFRDAGAGHNVNCVTCIFGPP